MKLILKDGSELTVESVVSNGDSMSVSVNGNFNEVSTISEKLTDDNLSKFTIEENGIEDVYAQFRLDYISSNNSNIWCNLISVGSTTDKRLTDIELAIAELYEMQLGGSL